MLTLVRYAVVTEDSTLALSARSTLHSIESSSRMLGGTIEAAFNDDDSLALEPAPVMHIDLPVESLSSRNAVLDKQLRDTLGSRAFPMVTGDLERLSPGDKRGSYVATGRIAVRGTAKTFDGLLTIGRDGNRMTVAGSSTIDMRVFGISPPRLFVLEVKPDVSVTLRLVAVAQ